ncbi:uncharacterized protein LOC132601780 [Lycium barbarum]|uniref:uncharacterized protein LOC132601780 n=1 Tax=Lycium barbarum TaxID=112863 RepID=UPI00293EA2D0|nr:uncharacterized protein LOC132601780 [Lycium barbarum]
MVRKIIEARNVINQSQLVQKNTNSVIRQQERTSWKCFMFRNEASAKAKFTMWLHFHGRMLTSDRLAKWGITTDPISVLCQVQHENMNNLFTECVFTKGIWDRLLVWTNRKPYKATTWTQYFQWSLSNAKGKSQAASVFKMVYLLRPFMNGVWTERNLRIFLLETQMSIKIKERKDSRSSASPTNILQLQISSSVKKEKPDT